MKSCAVCDAAEFASDESLRSLVRRQAVTIERLDDDQRADLKTWFAENDLPAVRRMNAAQCDRVLDHLMELPTVERAEA